MRGPVLVNGAAFLDASAHHQLTRLGRLHYAMHPPALPALELRPCCTPPLLVHAQEPGHSSMQPSIPRHLHRDGCCCRCGASSPPCAPPRGDINSFIRQVIAVVSTNSKPPWTCQASSMILMKRLFAATVSYSVLTGSRTISIDRYSKCKVFMAFFMLHSCLITLLDRLRQPCMRQFLACKLH